MLLLFRFYITLFSLAALLTLGTCAFVVRDATPDISTNKGGILVKNGKQTSCELGVIDSMSAFVAAPCLDFSGSTVNMNTNYEVYLDAGINNTPVKFTVTTITVHPKYDPVLSLNLIAVLQFNKGSTATWSNAIAVDQMQSWDSVLYTSRGLTNMDSMEWRTPLTSAESYSNVRDCNYDTNTFETNINDLICTNVSTIPPSTYLTNCAIPYGSVDAYISGKYYVAGIYAYTNMPNLSNECALKSNQNSVYLLLADFIAFAASVTGGSILYFPSTTTNPPQSDSGYAMIAPSQSSLIYTIDGDFYANQTDPPAEVSSSSSQDSAGKDQNNSGSAVNFSSETGNSNDVGAANAASGVGTSPSTADSASPSTSGGASIGFVDSAGPSTVGGVGIGSVDSAGTSAVGDVDAGSVDSAGNNIGTATGDISEYGGISEDDGGDAGKDNSYVYGSMSESSSNSYSDDDGGLDNKQGAISKKAVTIGVVCSILFGIIVTTALLYYFKKCKKGRKDTYGDEKTTRTGIDSTCVIGITDIDVPPSIYIPERSYLKSTLLGPAVMRSMSPMQRLPVKGFDKETFAAVKYYLPPMIGLSSSLSISSSSRASSLSSASLSHISSLTSTSSSHISSLSPDSPTHISLLSSDSSSQASSLSSASSSHISSLTSTSTSHLSSFCPTLSPAPTSPMSSISSFSAPSLFSGHSASSFSVSRYYS